MKRILVFLIFGTTLIYSEAYQKITFPSLDGLMISAFTYDDKDKSKPFILLFHQLGYSKGEYLDIMPKLRKMGFNVMAVDLRNGIGVNGITNETAALVLKKKVDKSRSAAINDVRASINYIKKHYSPKKLLLWGSSYSGSIVLMIGGDNPNVDAVLAFSPGEYFTEKGHTFVRDNVGNLGKPVFFTSAKNEQAHCRIIYDAIPSTQKVYFVPQKKGVHGSSVLWKLNPNNKEYWEAVEKFLKQFITHQ
jgi:dienelactone hydrolase